VEHEAVPQLDIFEALELWDWEARLLHKVWGNLDVVLDEIESRGGGAGGRQRPALGLIANPVDLVRPGINVEVSRSWIPCGPGNNACACTDTQVREGSVHSLGLEDDCRPIGRPHEEDLGRDKI
jgi:hypothetical protein